MLLVVRTTMTLTTQKMYFPSYLLLKFFTQNFFQIRYDRTDFKSLSKTLSFPVGETKILTFHQNENVYRKNT